MKKQYPTNNLNSLLAQSPQIADSGFSKRTAQKIYDLNKRRVGIFVAAGVCWLLVAPLTASPEQLLMQLGPLSGTYISALSLPDFSLSVFSESVRSIWTNTEFPVALLFGVCSIMTLVQLDRS